MAIYRGLFRSCLLSDQPVSADGVEPGLLLSVCEGNRYQKRRNAISAERKRDSGCFYPVMSSGTDGLFYNQIICGVAHYHGGDVNLLLWQDGFKKYKNVWFLSFTIFFLAQSCVWLTFLFEASHDFTGILPVGVVFYLMGMAVFYLREQPCEIKKESAQTLKAAPAAAGILHYGEGDISEQVSDYVTKLVLEKCDGPNHHLLHVAEYVRAMCIKADLSREEADFAARASLLHDIGKISIPSKVLMKETQLTQEEYEQIRCHVLYGDYLLKGNDPFLKLAAEMAKQHHEHYDGSGYLGLKGNEIQYYARMIAIADVFDALTSDRAYKKAWSLEEGFAYIDSHKGGYFDPQLADLFASCHDEIIRIHEALAQPAP